MSPRILYAAFDRVPSPKGASRHILALARAFSAAGVELDVVTPAGSGPLPQWEGVRFHPIQALPQNPLAAALAFGQELVALLPHLGPFDAWQLRDPWSAIPLLEQGPKPRPPLIWEANGLPSLEWPQHHPALGMRPDLLGRLRALERQLMTEADAILCVSPVTARCLQDLGAQAEKIRVIPNGVELADFHPQAAPGPWPELAYVGAMQPWQGITTLLEALAILGPPTRLLVAGPAGKWGAKLRRRAMELSLGERVQWVPAVSSELVPQILARAHAVVLPLDASARNVVQGACPLKLLEAWAAGRPVVASRVPLVEALMEGQNAALLVPPDQPQALAAGIQRVLNEPDLRQELVAAGLRRAGVLRWDAQVQSVLACLHALPKASPEQAS